MNDDDAQRIARLYERMAQQGEWSTSDAAEMLSAIKCLLEPYNPSPPGERYSVAVAHHCQHGAIRSYPSALCSSCKSLNVGDLSIRDLCQMLNERLRKERIEFLKQPASVPSSDEAV